jgi:hypothetical protein
MRPTAIAILVAVVSALGISAAGKDDAVKVERDLSKRDPAAFYDFNVDLLTHLGKRVKLDVTVAAKDLDRQDGWLSSCYYITPDELRGIELRIPQSAISDDGKDRVRVRGEFKLSEVMSHRQGHLSLHLLPAE